jgi:hypothetical protein
VVAASLDESFVMDSVAVRHVFLQVLPFFPVLFPPTHITIWDMDSGPIKPTEGVVSSHIKIKKRKQQQQQVTENRKPTS